MATTTRLSKDEERALALRARDEGCATSFMELVERLNLYRELFGFVMRYLRNPSDAEDVTQETVLRAYSKLSSFDPDRGRFRSWVMGIALRQAYDHMRQRKFQALDDAPERPSQAASPEEIVNLMQMEEALVRALEDLDQRQQRILSLFYVDGLGQQEIAQREGLSLTNVGTILARAREKWIARYEQWKTRRLSERRFLEAPEGPHLSAFSKMLVALNHRLGRSSGPLAHPGR